MDEEAQLTSDEWLRRYRDDPEFARRVNERFEKSQATVNDNLMIEKQILVDLAAVGHRVPSLIRLPQLRPGDPAVEILVAWLHRIDSPDVQSALARALYAPDAGPQVVDALLELYEQAEPGSLLQWTAGNSLGGIQGVLIDDLLRLASRTEDGQARSEVVLALAKHGPDPRIEPLVESLISDPTVRAQAVEVAGILKLRALKVAVQPLLVDPDEVVRECARLALARMADS